ncbi:hypothetical protein PsYK624_017040 [Phanerochaete sordida]|uniref:HTH APSES-type domain-containing protein n=1 Tax=Phanerochaete sordida TaxID=48140 RepID=A0A9P3G0C2_9APHY|nr:hypothetical protein PsYK624_017040 [Phanerochaete sordida]
MTFVSSRAATMSSGLLLEPMSSTDTSTPNTGQRFRPYTTPDHHVTKGRYITSNDPRGYIPVYEYPLNGQWIMLDMDDGYVLWTGIWKALGNSKADIVKMVESQPDLASKLRRVRGGYLKIQGTWMPYEIALRLARRVAWPIRHELVPLFGPTFPSTCLSPDQPGYGQVVKPGTGRRRARRTYAPSNPQEAVHDWSVAAQATHAHADHAGAADPPFTYQPRRRPAPGAGAGSDALGSPVQLHMPYNLPPAAASPPSPVASSSRLAPAHAQRYSPYPSAPSSQPHPRASPADGFSAHHAAAPSAFGHDIRLPPLQSPDDVQAGRRRSVVALPPITAMVDRSCCDDSAAVLRRLATPDADDWAMDTQRPRDEPSHRRLPPMRLSLSAGSRSSPSMTAGSPGASSLDSPLSPRLVTPVSGRSSFDGAHAMGSSPRTPAPGAHDECRSACAAGPPRAAPAARADADPAARAWRPW